MTRNGYLHAILICLFSLSPFSAKGCLSTIFSFRVPTDTNCTDHLFNNGKIWQNNYTGAVNDQFLLTGEYLFASVTLLGKRYDGVSVRYDICNDELIVPSCIGKLIQINKETVDSFKFSYKGKTYSFRNILGDSIPGLKGFVEVLYSGKSAVYVRHIKELYHMSGQNVELRFFQKKQVFLVTGNQAWLLSGKRDLFKILDSRKRELMEFIRRNRIVVSKNDPESYVPVIKYFDNLTR